MIAPESPTPPPALVALGIIIEAPFIPQLIAPTAMDTHVTSTLMPAPLDSATTFVSGGPGVLLSSLYTAGAAEKKTEHHYSPPDLEALIASLEEKREKISAAREAASEPAVQKVYGQALGEVDQSIAELKAGKAPAPQLTRTTFHETSAGSVSIDGETIYDYGGLDIVKATTTTRTTETPPVVLVAEKTFEYDVLGRITKLVQYETSTTFEYDPGGRVLSSEGEFASPEGDFKVTHRTKYIYAPPQSPGPAPGNAVMSSVNESTSGPTAALNAEREKLKLPPLPEPKLDPDLPDLPEPIAAEVDQLEMLQMPGLPKFKGLDPTDPKVEETTALNTYVYP
jgi:hypothetical protein